MADNKKALEMELRQIIQTDRKAVEILRQSEDARKTVVAKTEQEKAAILAEGARKRQEMEQRVQKDLQQKAEQEMKDAQALFARQKTELEQKMEQNKEAWAEEIFNNIVS